MSRAFVIALLAIVGTYFLYEHYGTSDSEAETSDSDVQAEVTGFQFPTAPNILATTMSGNEFDLEEHRGKVILLNFWATWCAPCWEEMPMLVELQDGLRDDGLLIVGISVDEDGPDIVREYMDAFDFNYEILHDDAGLDAQFGAEFAVPTTILIDKVGKVRHRIIGLIEEADLKPAVERLLGE